jgi:L-malate glycosyltransferase
MNLLVVNHTGLISGAEVATLHLLESLPGDIGPLLACPDGPLAEQARTAGVAVVELAGMSASLRLHPIETARGVKDLARLGREVRRLARRTNADVVYAASVRAGLAASMPVGACPPLVVGLHDCLPAGPLSSATKRLIDRRSAMLVANSRHTAAAWRDGRGGPELQVLHPPIEPGRYGERVPLGLDGGPPVIGVAAQITPWKGQETAIRALWRIRERHPDAQLVLAGATTFVERATRYDNRRYLDRLNALTSQLGVADSVRFLGRRDDLPSVLAGLDVLLVPSWEEPFGLVVIEAMAAGTPVVATSVGGPREVIVDGVNGRLVAPRQPELWADAVIDLLADERARDRMVAEGRVTARAFDRGDYGRRFAALCRSVALMRQ